MPRTHAASHDPGLNNSHCWLSQAKCKETSRIDIPGRRVMPTAELVSVPYSNPMFGVLSVYRFYLCLITDVYIGRSLHFTHVLLCLTMSLLYFCIVF